jgi:uncharacterized membrane protein
MDSTRVERSRDLERFITFIDAIVAIAITLLVLPLVDIAAGLREGSVTALLRSHLPEIGGFLLSFGVIANLWSNQHRVLRTVISQDPVLTRLLLAWTLTIVVLPFPTALVANVGSQTATKVIYIGTMAVSSALLTLIAWTIGRRPAIRDTPDKPHIAHGVGTTTGFLVALGLSLVFPGTGYYPLLLLLVASPLAQLWVRRHPA